MKVNALDRRIILLIPIVVLLLSGCAMVKKIDSGELYDYCNVLVDERDSLDTVEISIDSSGYLSFVFYMSKDSNETEAVASEVFQLTADYIDDINLDDKTFNDPAIESREIREIGILIINSEGSNHKNVSYHSSYYGGDTIYSDDDLNVIDNFQTWD